MGSVSNCKDAVDEVTHVRCDVGHVNTDFETPHVPLYIRMEVHVHLSLSGDSLCKTHRSSKGRKD